MKSFSLIRLLATGFIGISLTCAALPTLAADRGSVAAKFESTGIIDKAGGRADFRVVDGDHRLNVRLRGLSRNTLHTLTIGGIPVETFDSKRGTRNLKLEDFGLDPRGKIMEVEDEANDQKVLSLLQAKSL